jgi:hypothetical protein
VQKILKNNFIFKKCHLRRFVTTCPLFANIRIVISCWKYMNVFQFCVCKTYQRFQFFFINQMKFGHKIVEMFVASVCVRFRSNMHHSIKMMNVDVNKDTKQSCENLFARSLEVLRKCDIRIGGEDVLVIHPSFDPIHKQCYIFGCWHPCWSLELLTVLPEIFESESTIFSSYRFS